MTGAPQLVWLKRDLRLADHAPLARAAARGPVIVLYVHEPELLGAPEYDGSHHDFIVGSLDELDERLRPFGQRLVLRYGRLPEVFEALQADLPFEHIWSHEETGLGITYQRDLRVARWCKARGLPWTELPQTGVARPHKDRDGWSERWTRRMRRPLIPVPDVIPSPEWPEDFDFGTALNRERWGVAPSTKVEAVAPGETEARATLDTFLSARGVNYRVDMSSPVDAWTGCSRLSPYLAWGNVSLKTVFQHQQRRLEQVRRGVATGSRADPRWRASLESFESRLRWHCHFVQKLEDEPEIEFRNMHRGYDGLRVEHPDQWSDKERARFEAWCEGRTGYPLVDAVMRALHRGGWINFRMRAMLVSFASFHLWLHWRPCAVFLARHFLDFEPGIHFSQFQMQAGTTGINSVRIYNPIKQVADQDPSGTFVRGYVPELADVPIEYLAEPHKMSPMLQREVGCVIDSDYPTPIVAHAAAYNAAKARMFRWRQKPALRAEAGRVAQRHASRKRPRAWR